MFFPPATHGLVRVERLVNDDSDTIHHEHSQKVHGRRLQKKTTSMRVVATVVKHGAGWHTRVNGYYRGLPSNPRWLFKSMTVNCRLRCTSAGTFDSI
jgi:hypothetical protein